LICSNKDGWYLNVTADPVDGTIEVAYKISNDYFIVKFDVTGPGQYFVGDGSGKNGVNHAKVGAFVANVNLGFIGYYLYDGKVMSTSFYWQKLTEGDMIDWDAVDVAYDAWVAQGGLVPDRETGWLTSGFASFTFDDYDNLGFDDFTLGQLEGYYKAYYVDPGYLLPVVEPAFPPGFKVENGNLVIDISLLGEGVLPQTNGQGWMTVTVNGKEISGNGDYNTANEKIKIKGKALEAGVIVIEAETIAPNPPAFLAFYLFKENGVITGAVIID